jgi:hypothetical protein
MSEIILASDLREDKRVACQRSKDTGYTPAPRREVWTLWRPPRSPICPAVPLGVLPTALEGRAGQRGQEEAAGRLTFQGKS